MDTRQKMDCKTAQQMITSYIKRELTDRELEGFIEHIRECQECYEELEIYFTIHFALQKLDEDKNVSYNIQKMLKDDLRASERRVHRRKVASYYKYALVVLAQAALIMALLTRLQYWGEGSMKKTTVYSLFHGGPGQIEQPVPETRKQTEKETEIASKETEIASKETEIAARETEIQKGAKEQPEYIMEKETQKTINKEKPAASQNSEESIKPAESSIIYEKPEVQAGRGKAASGHR